MITIDGSFGEGGGQIVRSSLALAMVTGKPFRVAKMRAGRQKPGLMRQHLTAVRAAASICGATMRGDEIGSMELTFEPRSVKAGEYTFAVGTAGSATLVLQTVLPALLLADGPSVLTLEGGTHNPFAPPFDFLIKAFLPLVNRMGPRVEATLERPGFYPAGGGRFVVRIEPVKSLTGIEVMERGELRGHRATAVVANLRRHIAERELTVIKRKLNWGDDRLSVVEVSDTPGPGNIVMIEMESEHVTEVFTGFGEVGRSAEAVADQVLNHYLSYQRSDAPIGEYLTDQFMLPLAIAGAGAFHSTGLSRHATTHIELIRKFLDVDVSIAERKTGGGCEVRIGGGS